jgi:hypothetical protein
LRDSIAFVEQITRRISASQSRKGTLRQSRPVARVLRGPFGLELPEPFTGCRLGRGGRFFLLAPAKGLPVDEFRAVVRVNAQDGERERGGTGELLILRAKSLAGFR